jgi:hypothetical protein
VIETCVLPVLLYGSENWILTPLWDRLESELAKCVLHWPKHHSNTVATLAAGLQSMKSKFGFLQNVLWIGALNVSVSGRVVESMEGGVLGMCLGKKCMELEEMCGVHYFGREGDVCVCVWGGGGGEMRGR